MKRPSSGIPADWTVTTAAALPLSEEQQQLQQRGYDADRSTVSSKVNGRYVKYLHCMQHLAACCSSAYDYCCISQFT
jgi:hypothetical protein